MKGLKLPVAALLIASGAQATLWDTVKGYGDKAKALYEENKAKIEQGKAYLEQGKTAYDQYAPQVKEAAAQAGAVYDKYGHLIPTQTLREAANTAASTATVLGGK